MTATTIRRTAVTAIALLTAVASAACSSSNGGSNGDTFTSADLHTTTARATGTVDTLKWALPWGEPTSLDPAKVGDYSPAAVESNLCEGLVSIDPEFRTHPGLAEKISRPDDKTIVFDLRTNVKFWNGDKMTPEDVVYSLKRNTDNKVGSFWSSYYTSVQSIKATGPHQVTVKFTHPDTLFEFGMGVPAGAISQKSFVEKAGAKYGASSGGLMCTGPYKLDSWKPGRNITLSKNENYWNSGLRPKANSVRFSFVTDTSTLTTALQSGEFDGAYEVPVATAAALRKGDAGTVYSGPSTQMVELIPTEADGPMSNVDVRTALDLAIDKKAIATTVYGGSAQPLNSFIPPFMWGTGEAKPVYQTGYDKLQDTSTPDLDAAKALVEKANLSDNSFTVGISAGDEAGIQTLTYIQAAAKKIGLDMTIKQFQATQFSDMFYNKSARAAVDLMYALGYSEIANPLAYASYFAASDGLFNWTGYHNPKVAQLLQQAIRTLDPSKSAKLFVQAQAEFVPQRLAIPVVTPAERLFMKKGITGAPPSFSYVNMPWAAMVGAK